MKRLALVALILAAGTAFAEPKTYYFGAKESLTVITFESTTDFEQILGTCNKASGTVVLDGDKSKVKIEIPVAAMTNGIAMRDEHMKSDKWLDAAKYPTITFESTEAKYDGEKKEWAVKGKFTLHGVTKEITTAVKVTEIPAEIAKKGKLPDGDWIKCSTAFKIKLSDFGVVIPDMAKEHVSDTWDVKVAVFAGTTPPEKK